MKTKFGGMVLALTTSGVAVAWTQTRLVDVDLGYNVSIQHLVGDQVVSSAVAGTPTNALSWIAYEKEIVTPACAPGSPICMHELHLTRWDGTTPAAQPDIVLATEQHFFNPSIAVSGGQVFIAAQANGTAPCTGPQTSLKVWRYDIATGTPAAGIAWTALDSNELGTHACRQAGHTNIAVDAVHSQVTACATMKGADDDIWCSQSDLSGGSESPTVLANGGGDQDHAWLAFNATTGAERVAWHLGPSEDGILKLIDASTTSISVDCNVVGSADCLLHQQRPSLNLGGSQIRVAFEEQATGLGQEATRNVRFGYCNGTTGAACPQASWVWDTAAFDPNTSQDKPRKFPHLASSCNRVWMRYERELLTPPAHRQEAMVAWRASPVVSGGAWTLDDPWSNTTDEATEEHGTPHIAVSGTVFASTVETLTLALDGTIGHSYPAEFDLWVLEQSAPPCL